ncbi:hypothetical protein TRICI_005949 [Trichomonascus ciferrii]|uniref:Transcription initiation factor TFIID subunit 10 n=1 Tax=Trichomonascus ciferrii TaxID=44093 RepID=A0A642UPS2_9ASCO|nr:hypothetical protein TRICI_005949 [Trichomonascus ciferrii]
MSQEDVDMSEVPEEKKTEEEEKKEGDGEEALKGEELQDVDNEVLEEPQEENAQDNKAEGEEEDEEEAFKDPAPPPPPIFERKDKSLKEFLNTMDDYAPVIPDAVTDYYLAKSGFETSDRRIKRLLALATQKFVSDIACDAYQYSRIRSSSSVANSSNPQARARALVAGMSGGQQNAPSSSGNQGKTVLTMEDLGNALAEYGLNVKRPDFYR